MIGHASDTAALELAPLRTVRERGEDGGREGEREGERGEGEREKGEEGQRSQGGSKAKMANCGKNEKNVCSKKYIQGLTS